MCNEETNCILIFLTSIVTIVTPQLFDSKLIFKENKILQQSTLFSVEHICEVEHLKDFQKYWIADKNYSSPIYGSIYGLYKNPGTFVCYIESMYGKFMSSENHQVKSNAKFPAINTIKKQLKFDCDQHFLQDRGYTENTFSWDQYPFVLLTVEISEKDEAKRRIVIGNSYELIVVHSFKEDNNRNLAYYSSVPRHGAFTKINYFRLKHSSSSNCPDGLDHAPIWASTPLENKNVTCYLGEPVLIKCIAFGYPLPDIRFKSLNGINISGFINKEQNGIYIKECKFDYMSKYNCSAKNYIGEISLLFFLQVRGPPIVKKCTNGGIYAQNSKVTLSCHFQSPTFQSLSISVNGTKTLAMDKAHIVSKTHDTITLTILDLQPNDTAIYQFVAKNEYGNRVHNFQIEVLRFRKLNMVAIGSKILMNFRLSGDELKRVSSIVLHSKTDTANLLIKRVNVTESYIMDETEPLRNYTVAAKINFNDGKTKLLAGNILTANDIGYISIPSSPFVIQLNKTFFEVSWKSVIGAIYYNLKVLDQTNSSILSKELFFHDPLNVELPGKFRDEYKIWFTACNIEKCTTSPAVYFQLQENPISA